MRSFGFQNKAFKNICVHVTGNGNSGRLLGPRLLAWERGQPSDVWSVSVCACPCVGACLRLGEHMEMLRRFKVMLRVPED